MIEISVPQDIRDYEPTLVGFLTTRQCLAGAAMIGLVYGGYMLEKLCGVSDPMQIPVFVLLGIPPFLVGWWKPFGMHFEDFILDAFHDNFQAPSNRPYVVENMWDIILSESLDSSNKSNRNRTETRKKTPRSKLSGEYKAYR